MQFQQIGNQPRDGKFGACFVSNEKSIPTTRVICARPGSRIWECSVEGNVMKTHKFKNALEKEAATSASGEAESGRIGRMESMKHEINEQLVHLQIINKSFILGHTSNAFYIFDLIHSNIVLWNNDFASINTLKVIDNDTIVIFTNDYKSYSIQLKRYDERFFDLIHLEQYENGIEMLQKHISYFKNKLHNGKFRKYLGILRDKWPIDSIDCEKPLDEFFQRFDEICGAEQFLRSSKQDECDDGMDVFERKQSNNSQLRTIEAILDKENDLNNSENDESYQLNEKLNASNAQIQCELKTLAEEQKVLRNLFFIYKSLKISKFNIRERYAEFFDNYDLHGIKQLLNALQDMIMKNDCDATELEAKKTCAFIYLNYVKEDCLLSPESEGFALDCILLINSPDTVTCNTQRCQQCNFPLSVSGTVATIKYIEQMELIIKQLVRRNDTQRLFKIIEHIPVAMLILLKMWTMQHCHKSMSKENEQFIIDLFFACVHQPFDSIVQTCTTFHTYEFWKCLALRLLRLHDDMTIQCIRCRAFSKVNQVDAQFSYDNVFQQCLFFLTPLDALQLLNELSNLIPSGAIKKCFYLKCLLG